MYFDECYENIFTAAYQLVNDIFSIYEKCEHISNQIIKQKKCLKNVS